MLVHRAAFVIALLVTGAVAFSGSSSREERLAFVLLAADFLITPFLQDRSSWSSPQLGVFAIDFAYLVGLVLLAHRSPKPWLVASAAVQLIGLTLYLPFWLFPRQLYRAFYFAGSALGYALEGVLIWGRWFTWPSMASVRRRP